MKNYLSMYCILFLKLFDVNKCNMLHWCSTKLSNFSIWKNWCTVQDIGVTGGTGNTIARKWAEEPEEEYYMYITLFTVHSMYVSFYGPNYVVAWLYFYITLFIPLLIVVNMWILCSTVSFFRQSSLPVWTYVLWVVLEWGIRAFDAPHMCIIVMHFKAPFSWEPLYLLHASASVHEFQ